MADAVMPLKEKLERRLNLSQQVEGEKNCILTMNKVMRICLIASLSLSEKRSVDNLSQIVMSKTSMRIMPSFFTKDNKKSLFYGDGWRIVCNRPGYCECYDEQ